MGIIDGKVVGIEIKDEVFICLDCLQSEEPVTDENAVTLEFLLGDHVSPRKTAVCDRCGRIFPDPKEE